MRRRGRQRRRSCHAKKKMAKTSRSHQCPAPSKLDQTHLAGTSPLPGLAQNASGEFLRSGSILVVLCEPRGGAGSRSEEGEREATSGGCRRRRRRRLAILERVGDGPFGAFAPHLSATNRVCIFPSRAGLEFADAVAALGPRLSRAAEQPLEGLERIPSEPRQGRQRKRQPNHVGQNGAGYPQGHVGDHGELLFSLSFYRRRAQTKKKDAKSEKQKPFLHDARVRTSGTNIFSFFSPCARAQLAAP